MKGCKFSLPSGTWTSSRARQLAGTQKRKGRLKKKGLNLGCLRSLNKRLDVSELWRHAWEMMERRIKGAERKVKPGVVLRLK